MPDLPDARSAEPRATCLTAEQIAGLREQARREARGDLVDPRRLRRVEGWWSPDLHEWAEAVLGRTFSHLRTLPWPAWVLLDLAHDAEPTPPPPPNLTARREAQRAADEREALAAAARAEATEQEWSALRAQLLVEVAVAHNYTSRCHTEWHVQGADHILVLEPLSVGRLRRDVRQPLCWTPSRAQDLREFPHLDLPEDRWPTCKACLRTAYRIAGREHSPLLLPPKVTPPARPLRPAEVDNPREETTMPTTRLFDDAVPGAALHSSAVISECDLGATDDHHDRANCPVCDVYRYELRRVWDSSRPLCVWIMLNPSTADARTDDRTIAKCIRFAKRWGYGGILVLNLYALRATDPRQLWRHPDPVGPHNDTYLSRIPVDAMVVCAWGAHGRRGHEVIAALTARAVQLHHLTPTQAGQPAHPLYLKETLTPIPLPTPTGGPSSKGTTAMTDLGTHTAAAPPPPAPYPIAAICRRAIAPGFGGAVVGRPEVTDRAVRLRLSSWPSANCARRALAAHGYSVTLSPDNSLTVTGWDTLRLAERVEHAEQARIAVQRDPQLHVETALETFLRLSQREDLDDTAAKHRALDHVARAITDRANPPGQQTSFPIADADRRRTTHGVLRLLRRAGIAERAIWLLARDAYTLAAAAIDLFLEYRERHGHNVHSAFAFTVLDMTDAARAGADLAQPPAAT